MKNENLYCKERHWGHMVIVLTLRMENAYLQKVTEHHVLSFYPRAKMNEDKYDEFGKPNESKRSWVVDTFHF